MDKKYYVLERIMLSDEEAGKFGTVEVYAILKFENLAQAYRYYLENIGKREIVRRVNIEVVEK